MAFDIELLKQLQLLDKEIYDLNEEQKNIPLQIKAYTEKVDEQTVHVKEAEARYKEVKLSLQKKELELKEKEETIRKYEAQLFQIKTNKEYTALQGEIANLKADNSILEEDIIKMLDEVQNVETALHEEKERLDTFQNECNRQKKALEKKCADNEQTLRELNTKKEELAQKVDPVIFSSYERIIRGKNGIALAKVDSEESCGVCQMKLRSQTINEILLGKNIVTCENCSRILYMEQLS